MKTSRQNMAPCELGHGGSCPGAWPLLFLRGQARERKCPRPESKRRQPELDCGVLREEQVLPEIRLL